MADILKQTLPIALEEFLEMAFTICKADWFYILLFIVFCLSCFGLRKTHRH